MSKKYIPEKECLPTSFTDMAIIKCDLLTVCNRRASIAFESEFSSSTFSGSTAAALDFLQTILK